MDISSEFSKRDEGSETQSNCSSLRDLSDILDLTEFDLDSEDTWLYQPDIQTNTNYKDWLYEGADTFEGVPRALSSSTFRVKSKPFDTKTFTRPKRKISRPSIEQYEQLYSSDNGDREDFISAEVSKNLTSSFTKRLYDNVVGEDKTEMEAKPHPHNTDNPTRALYFDLSQPAGMHNFDSFISVKSTDFDSFQNMSPPSLVNSMCSSTFTNLMENSFIKNDPVLREIRDTDFTETALLQDTEAPMFQSITESCSSLNSDTPESFLKRVSRSNNNSFRKNASLSLGSTLVYESEKEESDEQVTGNKTFQVLSDSSKSTSNTENPNSTYQLENAQSDTFCKESTPEKITRDVENISLTYNNIQNVSSDAKINHYVSENVLDSENVSPNINGTYRRTPKVQHNGTFRKSDLKNNRLSLNLTFQRSKEASLDKTTSRSIEKDLNMGSNENLSINRTNNVILDSSSIEDIKKRYSTAEVPDLNRLSYCLEENTNKRNSMYKEPHDQNLNQTIDIKRSSLGSADSLDRMSSLSSSSKGSTRGSNKMLNMADIDAIVAMQERTLDQAMSTPKPNSRAKKTLWENNFISPIVSSTKEHVCSDSELSSDDYKSVRSSLSSKVSLESLKQPTKSLGNLAGPTVNNMKLKPAPRSTLTMLSNIRGSYTNLRTITNSNIGGSQSNLYRPTNLIRPPSQTNLRSMGTKLKGSYTSLKPISANLPVVAPASAVINSTINLSKATNPNVTQIIADSAKKEVRAKEKSTGDDTFVKPSQPKASGLPRPTGIPRPASRIPGPRSSNIRPTSARSSNNY